MYISDLILVGVANTGNQSNYIRPTTISVSLARILQNAMLDYYIIILGAIQ